MLRSRPASTFVLLFNHKLKSINNMKKTITNQYRMIFESKMNRPDFIDEDQNEKTDKANLLIDIQLQNKDSKVYDCGYKFWDEEIFD